MRAQQALQGIDLQRVPYSTGVTGRAGMGSWIGTHGDRTRKVNAIIVDMGNNVVNWRHLPRVMPAVA